MRLIKPNVEIIEQQPGLEGMYKQIELAGRTCYKSSPLHRWYSEDRTRWINENSEEWKFLNNPKNEYPIKGENISAKGFVDRMIKSGHGAMLEHGTVYLCFPLKSDNYCDIIEDENFIKYDHHKYSKINTDENKLYVTTNYRVLVENGWLDDLKYICEPTEFHEKRITVKWTCGRDILAEFTRHRTFSFAAESTRYCNYSKNKFENGLTFIIPSWVDDIPNNTVLNGLEETFNFVWSDLTKQEVKLKVSEYTKTFLHTAINSELGYLNLIENGYKPQQARQVLPNALKTELVMTGFESDWKHFFSLRSPKAGATGVHPDAAYLADKLYDKIKDKIK